MSLGKPILADFTDEDGYPDFYDYDMAMECWRSQFPDLRESWCGETKPEPVYEPVPSLFEVLSRALAA